MAEKPYPPAIPPVELVNVTVCARVQRFSGTPRVLAVVLCMVAVVPRLSLRYRLIPDPDHGWLWDVKNERWRMHCQPSGKVAQVPSIPHHTTRR